MSRPNTASIVAAYENVEAYTAAVKLLLHARIEVTRFDEHPAEHDCDGGHPLDSIGDAIGCLKERIDALRCFIGAHEEEDA